MPVGGFYSAMQAPRLDRLAGHTWSEHFVCAPEADVVFRGGELAVFVGDEMHRRATEFVTCFGGTRIPATRR